MLGLGGPGRIRPTGKSPAGLPDPSHLIGHTALHIDRNELRLNLASLDPALKLRGIDGLQGASNLDRKMWDEFHENPAELVPLSQERFDALFVEPETETTEVIRGSGIRRIARPPSGDTEVTRSTKQRRGQDYFREIILNNYGNRCAITGLPIRELLIASHILPWCNHEAERLNVRNGIALRGEGEHRTSNVQR